MSIAYLFTLGWQSGSDAFSRQITVTGDGEARLANSVAFGAVDEVIEATITPSLLKGLYINATQDLTLKAVNAGGTVATIDLKANKALLWTADYFANLFDSQVTEFQVTNSSGSYADFTGRILKDVTP